MKTTLINTSGLEYFQTVTDTNESLAYGLQGLSDEIVTRLALHGLKQKVGDAAAIPRDTETGKSATETEKLEAMRAVYEMLQEGEWSRRAEAGEGGSDGLLLSAICRTFPAKSREEHKAALAGKTKSEQSALLGWPKIQPALSAIRAERAKASSKKVDVESLGADFE